MGYPVPGQPHDRSEHEPQPLPRVDVAVSGSHLLVASTTFAVEFGNGDFPVVLKPSFGGALRSHRRFTRLNWGRPGCMRST